MNNKNCANYTDFSDHFYHKKIVQAPGGESHFSIGWSNEKTDYGPPRNSRSQGKPKDTYQDQGSYGKQFNQAPPGYGQGSYGQGGYQQPQYQQSQYQPAPYQPSPLISEAPQPVYQIQPPNSQQKYSYKQEGTYGVSGGKIPSTTNLYTQPEQIDLMTKEYEQKRMKPEPAQQTPQQGSRPPRPPSNPISKPEEKACIKIRGAPQSQIVFGDNSYNYWKDDNQQQSQQRRNFQQESQGSYGQPQSRSVDRMRPNNPPQDFKPSVKVHNPPGGKSNFQLG